jgi:hypothetical protein
MPDVELIMPLDLVVLGFKMRSKSTATTTISQNQS